MTAKLRVLAVSNVGWSDWGSVASILRSMVEIIKLDAFPLRLETEPSTSFLVHRFLGRD
jgi:hypothetical protein